MEMRRYRGKGKKLGEEKEEVADVLRAHHPFPEIIRKIIRHVKESIGADLRLHITL